MSVKLRKVSNPYRIAAHAAGDRQYLDPKPCPQGHVGARYTSNGACVTCSREKTVERARTGGRIGKWKRDNGSRASAIAAGLPKYNTGAPCKQGHMADRNTRDGSCVECQRLHSEKKNAEGAHTAWYEANIGRLRVYQKQYRADNKEVIRESQRRCHERDPTANAARAARWAKANPERAKENRGAASHRRRKRVWASDKNFTAEDVRRIFKAQKGKCAYCKVSLKKGRRIDHIVPLAKGGDNSAANIQLTCLPCNAKKSAKLPAAWAAELGLLL